MIRSLTIQALLFVGLIHLPAVGAIKPGAQITTQKINDNFYVLKGGNGMGANCGVLIQEQGVLLVDSMNVHKENNQALLKAIRAISDKPIRYVFNTHNHRDHSGGNRFFAKLGATIITQENTAYLREPTFSHLTFKDKLTLKFGDEVVEAFHMLSHTTDDAIIRFKHNNAVFTGDNHATTWGPATSYMGIDGMLKVLNKAINLSDDKTVVVPGHGEVVDRNHLLTFKADSLKWHDHVFSLDKKGVPLEKMINEPQVLTLFERFNGEKRENFMTDDMRSRRIKWHLFDSKVKESRIGLTAREYEELIGDYKLNNGEIAQVVSENGRLYLRIKNRYLTELLPRKDGKFEYRGWEHGEHATFVPAKDGRSREININMQKESFIGVKQGIVGR